MSSLDGGLEATQGRTGPSDDRPLTQQEYQLLQRLLSDPFSIPIQFKTWLVSYLETSDMNLPMSSIQGLTSLLGIAGVGSGTLGILPAGLIIPYGGSVAPSGAKMCDGATYTRASETRLFNAIGTSYGAPDALSFRVPDLQERIPVGRGIRALFDALGLNEGRALGQRGTLHNHGTHTHTVNRENVSLVPGSTAYSIIGNASLAGPNVTSTFVGPTSTPQDTPSYLVVNFIIVA